MRIAIDCRMFGMSGIGVYLENILESLIQIGKENSYLLIGDKSKLSLFESNSNCKVLHTVIPIFSFQEMFRFPVKEINTCDVFYTPNFNIPGGINIPTFSTIHDVVFMDVKGLTNTLGRIIRKVILKRALHLSIKVFTVSEFSKSRILHHFKQTPEIVIAGGGVNCELKKFKKNSNNPYGFSYVLFIGNIKKHKGLGFLLNSFHQAKKNGLEQKLVIVGSYDSFRTSDNDIIRLINDENKNIVFTGSISNMQLFDSIAHASLLVQPSKYEGFGLPPLEALYLGCPVLLSDIPVFKEIYGDFPVDFFNLEDSNELAEKMEKGCQNGPIPNSLQAAIDQKYSFSHSAEIILDKFELVRQ